MKLLLLSGCFLSRAIMIRATVAALFLGIAATWHECRAAESVSEFGVRAVEHIQRFPDCKFIYTASREGSPSDYEVTVEFCKSNGMFYFKQLGANGEVLDLKTYDGKSYQWLDHHGELVMATDFNRISNGFLGAFSVHPLFGAYHHVFLERNERFALPFLSDAALWKAALLEFKPVTGEDTGKSGAVTFTRDSGTFVQSIIVRQDRPYPTSATFRLKDQSYVVEWRVLEELSIPLGESGDVLRIPSRTNQTRTTAASAIAPPSHTEVMIQPGSFQLLKEQIPDFVFRVPTSSARRVKNVDLEGGSR